jgi:hypothetical protein
MKDQSKISKLDPQQSTYSYEAFGLGIHSNFPLPELIEGTFPSDIAIRLEAPAEVPPEAKEVPRWIQISNGDILLAWRDMGTIRLRKGCEVAVAPCPGTALEVVRLFVLGVGMSLLLQQRGLPVFHGSAVSINGSGVGFVGWKGFGKSTLAAGLHARGHPFLSDDALVLRNGRPTPSVLPGFPQAKLWPDAVKSIFSVEAEEFPRLRSEIEKRAVVTAERFSREPVPLKIIFLIAGGEEIEIKKLEPREALIRLMPHWYGAWTSTELFQALGPQKHLLDCGIVVNTVPVYLLKRPQSIEHLPEVARKVEDCVNELSNDLG